MAKSAKAKPKAGAATNSQFELHLNRGVREGALIGLVALSVYLFLALGSYDVNDPGWASTGYNATAQNVTGKAGAWIASLFIYFFGYVAYLAPLHCAFKAWALFRDRHSEATPFNWPLLALRSAGFITLVLTVAALISLYPIVGTDAIAGGLLGQVVSSAAVSSLNLTGSTLVLVALFLLGVTVYTGLSWVKLMDAIGARTLQLLAWLSTQGALSFAWLRDRWDAWQDQRKAKQAERPEAKPPVERQEPSLAEPPLLKPVIAPKKALDRPITAEPPASKPAIKKFEKPITVEDTTADNEPVAAAKPAGFVEGPLPPLSLLDDAVPKHEQGYSEERLTQLSQELEQNLKNFGISVRIVEVNPGPVITRFEMEPAAGVKASRITSLASDLARSLAVESVRVVENIAGKTHVGIEVPNEQRDMVRLREVLESDVWLRSKSPLSLALGHDIAGDTVIADLAKMPHLLVAGATGAGKSVGINAMILSILYKSTPADVRLIMVDPKVVELSVYEGIPHLLTPPITDSKEAISALNWSVAEMERRYKWLAAVGARNLAGYNQRVNEAIAAEEPIANPLYQPSEDLFENNEDEQYLKPLPLIVLIVDEFADLMLTAGKKVEEAIARITAKARAAGIHLILTTQRPSREVVTGLIKSNIPTRIGFKVSSRTDSRIVLDQGGAEQLLGHGDMLYLPPGTASLVRVHGAFVDDDEVRRVVDDWKRRGEPEYLDEIISGSGGSDEEGGGFDGLADAELDPLFDQAVAFVTETRRVSISSVQRKLKVGYNRAANLVEAMEQAGVISPPSHNGAREVLAGRAPGD